MARIVSAAILIALSSCGTAHSDDMSIQIMNAQDGTSCYVLVQNGEGKGVSCK